MRKKFSVVLAFVLILGLLGLTAGCSTQKQTVTPTPANPDLILATTTSTQDSGLLDVLIPDFEKKTGYKVKPVAVGSGAAIAMGTKGEADVLLVHAPASEQPLVDNQTVINYQLIMHNDFIILGPANDPAGIKNMASAKLNDVMKALADKKALFVSRGDDSGTDKAEKALWTKAGITAKGNTWYIESGTGMGATLTMASEKGAYTLTDRATYLANKANLKLEIVRQGDGSLLNIYHVMQVNNEKFPKVNKDGAKAFVDYMISADAQKLISEYGKDKYGEALFFADAGKTMEEIKK